MALVTQSEAARLVGLSRRTLDRKKPHLVQLGLTKLVGGRWLYESVGLLEAINSATERIMPSNQERMMPTSHQVPAGDEIPPWAESKARREHYLALRTQRELEELEGTLVLADAVRAKLFEQGRRIRNQIQAIPARVAADVAAETDVATIEIMLDRAIYDCLIGLERMLDD